MSRLKYQLKVGVIMANDFVITKRNKEKGNDGYKVFSVRIKDETVDKLDEISKETNRSRNEIINMMLEFAVDKCIIDK